VQQDVLSALEFHCVGPTRGGRVTTVAAHNDHDGTFYMGATGGGIWKTNDYGSHWKNISDGYLSSASIGSICVAPSDSRVIYAGTGSDGIRSNVILGKGIHKSCDEGKTWTSLGLEDAGQIGAIIVDPEDPNIALVAAIGNPFAANPSRGVFRTVDGGITWHHTLFISDSTGAVDLEFAPGNPNLVYASMWRVDRKPWTIVSGGYEGGIFRSTDGGVNWQKLSTGLPSGLVGKSDLAVSRHMPGRLWVLMEAPEGIGGVYRSDDYGDSFRLISTKKELLDRPFYFCNIAADPQDANRIFVGSTALWQSDDGGKKWAKKSSPHADVHALWIDPNNSKIMVQGNDGGATITRDGGITWSSIHNQPTAELYQVNLDDQHPYHLYAGQQDNTTIAIPSVPPFKAPGGHTAHWVAVGGCETGPAVPKPGNPNIVYSNCKGRFSVYNKLTGQEQQYAVGAANMYGHNPRDLTYRFQRVAPIHVSPHNPDVIYHASQYLHKTTDEGKTWETISPDLTAFTPETQVISGSPITRDITGEEFFSTIYSVQESPLSEGTIWVGSNDGPVHLTLDGGRTWSNVTPPSLPRFARIQTIEASPHHPGKAYIAAYRYLLGDFQPYIFLTTDYGKNWKRLTTGSNGIPVDYPTRVVREDPNREGLLYAGTEFGIFISFDDGNTWLKFQNNLPVTPVTDIKLHEDDLVLSTMGRSFWIMDDISSLRQIAEAQTEMILKPKTAYRYRYDSNSPADIPHYPPAGIQIRYLLQPTHPKTEVKIYDQTGRLVRSIHGESPNQLLQDSVPLQTSAPKLYQSHWDLRHETMSAADGQQQTGPLVAPGTYRIDLIVGLTTLTTMCTVLADPRATEMGITQADLEDQASIALKTQHLLIGARNLKSEIRKSLQNKSSALAKEELLLLEAELVTKSGRYQEPKLIDQISYLYSMLNKADQKPGKDAIERFANLEQAYNDIFERMKTPGASK